MTVGPYPAPALATARRLEWQHLPPLVRAKVEQRVGSPVTSAASQRSGFTPGFASILTCADGSRHFVKAASVKAQGPFAHSYRVETSHLARLPASVPAPGLLWVEADDDWVIMATTYVNGTTAARPWRPAELDALLDSLEEIADTLTPPPPQMRLDTFADDTADWARCWAGLSVPHSTHHAAQAARMATEAAHHVGGNTVVHSDVRADNVIIDASGRALVCDWNWAARGAIWLDSVMALLGPRGDGLDVETVIASRRLLRGVPAESIDSVLALLTGYFLRSAAAPVPRNSPHLRTHQRWYGEVAWEWLCERRGWARADGGTGG